VMIEGQAGTGKSTTLTGIARAYQAAGRQIVVTSTAALAAERLAHELGGTCSKERGRSRRQTWQVPMVVLARRRGTFSVCLSRAVAHRTAGEVQAGAPMPGTRATRLSVHIAALVFAVRAICARRCACVPRTPRTPPGRSLTARLTMRVRRPPCRGVGDAVDGQLPELSGCD
jgi:hypothetical protein